MKSRIAFLIYSLGTGGAERVVTTLANHLCEYYDVYIFTLVKENSHYPIKEDVKLITISDAPIQSHRIYHALKTNFFFTREIIKLVRVFKIELLVGFMTTTNILAVISSKYVGIPSIISERTNPAKQELSRIWRLLRRVSYPKANSLVLQTVAVKSYFEKMGISHNIRVLPNPISEELSQKRKLNGKRENFILNIGRLTELKGQDDLIRAFATTDNSNWKLIIAGEGPFRQHIESLIKELNLYGKVKLLGRLKDVSELYNTSKIFAFSSKYEGFPNALLEAMYFGLACVSTNCPFGPSDLIKEGINGYLVPVGDIDKMSERLNYLMHNPDHSNIISKEAIETTKRYEGNQVVKLWMNEISRLLAGKKN